MKIRKLKRQRKIPKQKSKYIHGYLVDEVGIRYELIKDTASQIKFTYFEWVIFKLLIEEKFRQLDPRLCDKYRNLIKSHT